MVDKQKHRLIKKYPNRRLYDTQSSSYVTLADIKQLVLDCEDFSVIDAKSSEDLTRSILLQIILEEEAGGMPMFSQSVLAQIIRLYGNTMQSLMGSYLEKNVQIFTEAQDQFQTKSSEVMQKNFASKDAWANLMASQPQNFQTLMTNYLEQSKTVFSEVEKQMKSTCI